MRTSIENALPPTKLSVVREQLAEAVAARKCHGCGCLHSTVEALAETDAGRGELAPTLAAARAVFTPKKYDCLGCAVCYPALATNAFAEVFPEVGATLDLCPTEAPALREGWPPLAGDYHVVRYRASVAVCTLHDGDLAARLAARAPEGLAIVGTLHTENLGIERVIRNVLANPHIRALVLCGADTRQTVGHLPGQSLESLFGQGFDAQGRIRGARGTRPVLKNVSPEQVTTFREQIRLVARIGVEDEEVILREIATCAAEAPGPFDGAPVDRIVMTIEAREPARLTQDPSGYLVVYPDRRRSRLAVEHYSNAGVLDAVVEGTTATALYSTLITRGLLSRLDHAAYLGRELARAERSLETGEPYVQDRAPGESPAETPRPAPGGCGCAGGCTSGGRS